MSNYKRVREKVDEKKKFYQHLTSFVVMGVFFFVLNMMTSPYDWWFQWPIFGWGIGVAMHYFKAFGFPGVGPTDEQWEQREMEKEMRKLNKGSNQTDEDYLDLPELERQAESKPQWKDEDLV
jgi:hypothetical protein